MIFSPPSGSITDQQLQDLRLRIEKLMLLIDKENRTGHLRHEERLAQFVTLDPQRLNYEDRLRELMQNSPQPDPLQDNIQFAQAMLLKKPIEKIALLGELVKQYPRGDGAQQARLEWAKMLLEQRSRSKQPDEQQRLLLQSQQLLRIIIDDRPDTFLARCAGDMLERQTTP